ncbi:MAG: hypothetical protein QXW35_05215 [Candidatus Aenigmatarchaeota archaeon]
METKLEFIKFMYNLFTNFEKLEKNFNFIELYKFNVYLTLDSNPDKVREYRLKHLNCCGESIKTIKPRQTNLYLDFINNKIIQDNLSTKHVIILDFDNFKDLISSIIGSNNAVYESKIYLMSPNFIIEKITENIKKLKTLNNCEDETINKFLSIINDKWLQFKNVNNNTFLLSLENEQIDNNNINKPKTFITLYSEIKFYGLKQCGQNGYKSKSIIKDFFKTIKQEYKQAFPDGHINLHYNDIPCPDLKCCVYFTYITFEVSNILEVLLLTEIIDYIKYI